MRENGLNARRRGIFIPTANANHGLPVCAKRKTYIEQVKGVL
jgi:hypothetical protein